jgi:hypothetical protein
MHRASRHNVFRFCRDRWAIFAATLYLTLTLTQPAQAKTFHCEEGDVACLIAAINTANANGHKNTIVLEACAYILTAIDNATNGPNGLPSITSTLTIKGAGADATTITRVPSLFGFRLMYVGASGNLTLEGVTLSAGGQGLFNDGGTVHIVQSAITGNGGPLTDTGGGLFNEGGIIQIVQSAITGNNVHGNGGGLYNDAGDVTIEDSTFAMNSADTAGGLLSINGTLTIRESRFSHNGATFAAGGVVLLGGGSALITKSTFDGNSSGGGAGAIALSGGGGTLVVTDSAFTENRGGFPSPDGVDIFDTAATVTTPIPLSLATGWWGQLLTGGH